MNGRNAKLPVISEPKPIHYGVGKRPCGSSSIPREISSQKEIDRGDLPPKMVPFFPKEVKSETKSIPQRKEIDISDIPLINKLPRTVPMCFRTSWDNDVAQLRLKRALGIQTFNSRDLIHKNCFSSNLITENIEARRRGIVLSTISRNL